MTTPSGKGASDENFPVGSILLPKALRPHVMCFYNFARQMDDIADNPSLSAQDKISQLDAFAQALSDGSDDPVLASSEALHISLLETDVTHQHGLDLIAAFKQDAVKSRYEDWGALIGYCKLSAAPVGRYLLDLHGENPDIYPASDALCHALQIINHLQDVADDKHNMDRVYVPMDWLEEQGLDVSALEHTETMPQLRVVFNKMLDGVDKLLEHSSRLAPAMKSRHLSAETRVIQALAETLTRRLYTQDPIAQRVELSKPAMLLVAMKGIIRL